MPNNRASVEFVGDVELIKKLERLQGNVPQAIAKAMKVSMQIPADEMLSFIRKHHLTGLTEQSFVFEEPVIKKSAKGTKVVGEVGFSVRKGGIASIFLNLGGLRNPPYFFIKKAVEGNIDRIAKAQSDAIADAIKETGL